MPLKPPAVLLAAFSLSTAFSPGARADFNFPNFPSATGLTLVGNATVTNNLIRVTPATANQVGAAWHTTRQNVGAGFSTTFTFRITNLSGGGADGFAFVIQDSASNAIGLNGCRIGYHGMPRSLAVEFDTWLSTTCDAGSVNDPNDNHVSIHTRGTLPNSAEESASIGSSITIPNISDGATHTVRIDYAPGAIDVYVDDLTQPRISAPLDLSGSLALTGGLAWVGFTAATGGSFERHEIQSWSFTEGAPAGAGRPRTPIVTEPNVDGAVRNPQDVHMECNDFFSSAGHAHLCTDWEIWTVTPSERVWHALCVTGVERLHIHQGDGVFTGSHTGRSDFIPNTDYVLRCRHRDNSGIPATEWSLFGQRTFRTGSVGSNIPLSLDDVTSTPRWVSEQGAPIILPASISGSPATVAVGSAHGDLLLLFTALDGVSNILTNPPPLDHHEQVRIAVDAGASGLNLPESRMTVVDHHCASHTFYLPAFSLTPGQKVYLWISTAGNSYWGTASQQHADLTDLARGSGQPFVSFQEGYVVEKFATNLQLPVNIAFVPNPGPNPNDVFFYVTELYGIIKMVTRDGTVSDYATGLVNFNPTGNFPGSGEQGLAGIVVHAPTGDVYASVLYDDGTGNHYPKVIRCQSADGGRTASTITDIITMPNEPMGQSHQISNLTFGPDGMLYVHVGDGFVASTGQNLGSFRGKILRMTTSGAAPPDNPFYNATDGITARDYVYQYGHRNPFGGAWRLSDGRHYIVENGPSVDRLSGTVVGRNMLWNGTDASMFNFALYNWNPAKAPVNIEFIQSSVFNGSGFPPEKFDRAFVAESGPTYANGPQALGKRVVEFEIDSSGALVSGPTTLVEYAGPGRATCVGLAAGPDGLYFTDLYKDLDAATPIDRGANVWRIRYVGDGQCCTADFNGVSGVTVQDIFDFLAAYFGGDTRADVNGSGAITVQDIFDFLTAYFAGCE